MAHMKEVLRKIENQRMPQVVRYQDLDALVNRFFSDGHISDIELKVLGRLDQVLTNEFRVAQEHFAKIDASSPLYAKAQDLINYLYRCRNLIDAAHDKAKVYNTLSEKEKKRLVACPQQPEPEVLKLTNIDKGGILLMKGLLNAKQRQVAEHSFNERGPVSISPSERLKIEARLDKALVAMSEQRADTMKLNRILGLRGRVVGEMRER